MAEKENVEETGTEERTVVTTEKKYKDMVVAGKKGKNKKPLISAGKGYEITLND